MANNTRVLVYNHILHLELDLRLSKVHISTDILMATIVKVNYYTRKNIKNSRCSCTRSAQVFNCVVLYSAKHFIFLWWYLRSCF